jgi:hypothetical protein
MMSARSGVLRRTPGSDVAESLGTPHRKMSHERQPVASLVAETEQARAALGERDSLRITSFPFKVGREGRWKPLDRLKSKLERRLTNKVQLNDLYLLEPPAAFLHVSREHFLIDWVDGRFIIADRGSAGGTIVGTKPIGADAALIEAEVKDGDRIVVGSGRSPYVFRFHAPDPH